MQINFNIHLLYKMSTLGCLKTIGIVDHMRNFQSLAQHSELFNPVSIIPKVIKDNIGNSFGKGCSRVCILDRDITR